jgi:hypothetical protein
MRCLCISEPLSDLIHTSIALILRPWFLNPQGGIEKLLNLKVLFMSNNKIAAWSEIDRLAALDKLEDLLLVGNPLYNEARDGNTLSDYRIEVRASSCMMVLTGIPNMFVSLLHSILRSEQKRKSVDSPSPRSSKDSPTSRSWMVFL